MKRPAIREILLTTLFFVLPNILSAHPVSFKGAKSLMIWNQPFLTDIMATYSFRNNAAAAATYMRMDMEDGAEMKYYGPQLNWLARRWNGNDHQANIYISGGAGGFEMDERKKTAVYSSLEADYETPKIYFSSKFSSTLPRFGSNIHQTTLRAGVSVHEAEFDEMSHWLILEVQHNTQLEHTVTVTPLLRTFYRNVLTEFGASLAGDWMLNFMTHF